MDSSLKYSDDLYVTTAISSKEVEVRRGEVYRFSSGLQTLAAGAVKLTVNADLIYEQL